MILGIPGMGGMAGGPELLVLLLLVVFFGMAIAVPIVFGIVGYVLGKRNASGGD